MKVRDLLQALGDIDDRYLIEQYEPIRGEKNIKGNENIFRKEVIIMDRKILNLVAIVAFLIVMLSIGISSMNKNSESDIVERIQINNPITEVNSIDEMKNYLGFDVPLLDKEVESYIVIGDDDYAAHARIIYKDGTQFNMEEGNSNVSGIYGGTVIKEEIINNIKVTFYSYESIVYANWTKDGYSYSYQSDNSDIDEEELNILLNY